MRLLTFLIFIVLLSSCNKALVKEESLIKETSLTDSSTQYYISQTTLPGFLSTEYYKIQAYLTQEDSHFILFSHFNNFEIEDGVKIKIERNKTDLIIKAGVPNYKWQLLLQEEDYFLNNSEIDFTIEVQNGVKEGAFIHIWENFRVKNNVVKSKRSVITEETLLAGTENIVFYEQGEGLKWGLKLFRTHLVKGVRVSPPVL